MAYSYWFRLCFSIRYILYNFNVYTLSIKILIFIIIQICKLWKNKNDYLLPTLVTFANLSRIIANSYKHFLFCLILLRHNSSTALSAWNTNCLILIVTYKMEKFRTLNNRVAKEIIRLACVGCFRAVYILLYNYRDAFVDEVYHRICTVVAEIAPLTIDIYNSLPKEVQSYYNRLWLTY